MSLYIEDNDNDRYLADMPLFQKRKVKWGETHPLFKKLRKLVWGSLAVGCVAVGITYFLTKDLPETNKNVLPLFIAIWVTMAFTYAFGRVGKQIYEQPFYGLHNCRFEASDYGLYYIYQQGMTLVTYYIKDKNIKEIIRDDECSAVCIRGHADTEVHGRKGIEEKPVEELYALISFDEYDLDDLLAPYGDLVKVAPGTLRVECAKKFRR